MIDSISELQAKYARDERLRQAEQARRADGVRRPRRATRHSLASQLRRFADRLDS
ncbi:hypothetical protein [Nocardioides sp. KR10-350]|uniref:hypothetical protein n=1 Tax=Nocardioides cheoyonin TaxID=3156615 RepID=UPI0032B3D3C5